MAVSVSTHRTVPASTNFGRAVFMFPPLLTWLRRAAAVVVDRCRGVRQLRVASLDAEERRPLGCAKEVGRETRESVEPVAGADPQITQAYRDDQRTRLWRWTREAGPARRRRRPHIRRTKLE